MSVGSIPIFILIKITVYKILGDVNVTKSQCPRIKHTMGNQACFSVCTLEFGRWLFKLHIDISRPAMLHYMMEILKKLRSQFNIYILKELIITLLVSMGVLTFHSCSQQTWQKWPTSSSNKGVGFADILLLIVYSTPPYLTFHYPWLFFFQSLLFSADFLQK